MFRSPQLNVLLGNKLSCIVMQQTSYPWNNIPTKQKYDNPEQWSPWLRMISQYNEPRLEMFKKKKIGFVSKISLSNWIRYWKLLSSSIDTCNMYMYFGVFFSVGNETCDIYGIATKISEFSVHLMGSFTARSQYPMLCE